MLAVPARRATAPLTGVTSTAGSSVGTLTNTAATAGAGATGTVNATANSTAGVRVHRKVQLAV